MRQILLLFLMISSGLFAQEQQDWELKKDKNGIKIFTRSIEGSKIKEYKGEMLIRADIETITEHLVDYELMTDWNKTIVNYKVIGQRDGGDLIYMENKAPWPVGNRDNVAIVHTEIDSAGSVYMTIKGLDEDLVPVKNNLVRMTQIQGFWEIKVFEDQCIVRQQMHADPSGNIPVSFVNSFMASTAFKSFQQLKKTCESKMAN